MSKNTLTQTLSISLSVAMALSSTPIPAGAFGPVEAPTPAFAKLLAPSEELGYVASSYSSDLNAEHPRVVIVSDLHGHLEVQRHIVGILDSLVNKLTLANQPMAGKRVPILMEGGWTPNLEEPLKTISNSNVRTFFKEYFLEKAEMGAAQAYSEQVAGQGKVSLIGVENEDEYKANKAQFARTYPARKAVLEALHREEVTLQKLSGAISNSSFEALQKMRDDYYAGRISPEKFARALVVRARHFGIENSDVQVLRSVSTASPEELEPAFLQIYRLVASRIAQRPPLTSFLRKSLGDEKDLREKIARIDAQMDLLKRLVGNQLTPAEVQLALDRMPALISLAQMLTADDHLSFDVAQVVRESLDFYPYALLRDESLATNSIAALDKLGPDATGILVVGGFHSDAIAEYLRGHQISYVEINPTITRDITTEEQLNYVKRVCDDHVTPKELDADIQWLKDGGRARLSASAIGPVSDLSSGPTSPDVVKMGAELTAPQVAAVAVDGPVLAAEMERLGVAIPTEVAAAADEPAVAQDRLANVQRLINAASEKNPELADLPVTEATPGFTIVRQGNQWVQAGNADSPYSPLMNDVFSGISDDLREGVSHLKAMDVIFLDDEVLKAHRLQAGMIGKIGAEQRPMMILPESRRNGLLLLDKINRGELDAKTVSPEAKTAINRAIHDFVHELFGHQIMKLDEKGEARAAAAGILLGAKIAARHFANTDVADSVVAEVQNFLEAITPQVAHVFEGWEDQIQDPTLAEHIADLIAAPQLNEADVESLIGDLQTRFPNVSPEEWRAQVEAERTGIFNRISAGNPSGFKNRLIAIGRKLTFRKAADTAVNDAS